MPELTRRITKAIAAIALASLALVANISAQTNQNPKPDQADDVVRVNTQLVQTDVMVFDKQGRFVNGLKREDFELRIDGKPQAIQFFERISAGAANEEAQLAAARGATVSTTAKGLGAAVPLDRGRT